MSRQNRNDKRNVKDTGKKVRLTKQEKLEENVPSFIKNQPWYFASTSKDQGDKDDFLAHQRSTPRDTVLDINNQRGYQNTGINDTFVQRDTTPGVSTKRVCKNCGVSGHKFTDCLETRRRVKRNGGNNDGSIEGSNKTRTDFLVRPDTNDQSYDKKRDRWYGYSGESTVAKSDTHVSTESKIKEVKKITVDEEIELRLLGLQPVDVPDYFKDRSSLEIANGGASIRLREEKAVYLKDIKFSKGNVQLSDFQAEGTSSHVKNDNNNKEEEEEELRYDPKTRIYKDETQGFVNPNNNMFYRYKTGEGLEFETLQKKLKYIQKTNRDEDSSLKLVDSDISKKVLIANPTMYERLLKQKSTPSSEDPPKRDLSKLEATKSKGTLLKKDELNKYT